MAKRSRSKNRKPRKPSARESSAQTSSRHRRINSAARSARRKVSLPAPRHTKLIPRQLDAKDRALEALGKMRREGWSFRQATDWAHVDRRTARKYLGSALLKPERKGGELRAAKGDRLTRNLLFASADGSLDHKPIRGSKAASELSDYWKELKSALRHHKLTEFAAKWEGAKIGGRSVLTDAAKIQELADSGLLKFETLYKQARGGGR